MPNSIKRLPDSELEIMMIVWEAKAPISSAYISEKLVNRKDWKITSILTFLTRLAEKGFITVERRGKSNIYTAVVKEEDYLKKESRSFLNKLYGNSLTSFVSSLYKNNDISEEDINELKAFIDMKTKGDK